MTTHQLNAHGGCIHNQSSPYMNHKGPPKLYENLKATINKHGLSRYIDADIKRQLRQECGYGCVICGIGIYQYEHIDPEFHDAKTHDTSAMALLCGACHDRITHNKCSKSKAAIARANPINLLKGTTSDFLDLQSPISIKVGNSIFSNFNKIVSVQNGEDWFTIDSPEEPGAPPRINAKFYSKDGEIDLEIVNNEWIAYTEAWDITYVGPILTIRKGLRKIALRLIFEPPHVIKIDEMNMDFYGNSFSVNSKGTVRLSTPNSSMKLELAHFKDADSIIKLPENILNHEPPKDSRAVAYHHECVSCGTPKRVWAVHEKMHEQSRCICGSPTRCLIRPIAIATSTNNKKSSQENNSPTLHSRSPVTHKFINCKLSNSRVGMSIGPDVNVEVEGMTMNNIDIPIEFK